MKKFTKEEIKAIDPNIKFYTWKEARKFIKEITGTNDYETINHMVRDAFISIKDDDTYVYNEDVVI